MSSSSHCSTYIYQFWDDCTKLLLPIEQVQEENEDFIEKLETLTCSEDYVDNLHALMWITKQLPDSICEQLQEINSKGDGFVNAKS